MSPTATSPDLAATAARAAAVRPSPAQLAWHEMELTTFIHFGPNTVVAGARLGA